MPQRKERNRSSSLNPNLSLNRIPHSSQDFEVEGVHQHFDCGCHENVKCNFNIPKQTIEVTAQKYCPNCPSGRSTEIIIGHMTDYTVCTDPTCECEASTCSIPVPVFLEWTR